MKVTFDFAQQSISIEGEELELIDLLQVVRQITPSIKDINIRGLTGASAYQNGASSTDAPVVESPQASPVVGRSGVTIRGYTKRLNLKNVAEKIAAIAYYKKTHEKLEAFSPKEMSDWFSICGFAKPTQMGVALATARQRYGYFESIGRGTWRITTNGENLVIGKENQSDSAEE